MTKTNLTIGIDSNVLDLARLKYPRQLSQLIEDFLRDYLQIDEVTEDNRSFEARRQEVFGEMTKLRIKKETIDKEEYDLKKEEEAKQQEAERVALEKSKCPKCGFPVGPKDEQMYGYHSKCYMNLTREEREKIKNEQNT